MTGANRSQPSVAMRLFLSSSLDEHGIVQADQGIVQADQGTAVNYTGFCVSLAGGDPPPVSFYLFFLMSSKRSRSFRTSSADLSTGSSLERQ